MALKRPIFSTSLCNTNNEPSRFEIPDWFILDALLTTWFTRQKSEAKENAGHSIFFSKIRNKKTDFFEGQTGALLDRNGQLCQIEGENAQILGKIAKFAYFGRTENTEQKLRFRKNNTFIHFCLNFWIEWFESKIVRNSGKNCKSYFFVQQETQYLDVIQNGENKSFQYLKFLLI